MKKTYLQPATRTVIVDTQRLMDTWSIESDDLNYGGTGSDNFYRSRRRSVWGDDDDWDELTGI